MHMRLSVKKKFLEEFWDADDEFQAQGHCLRKVFFVMEGVLFSLKSQNKSLVLDQPMIGLIHPCIWQTHFAESCFTIYSTHLWQPTHMMMITG